MAKSKYFRSPNSSDSSTESEEDTGDHLRPWLSPPPPRASAGEGDDAGDGGVGRGSREVNGAQVADARRSNANVAQDFLLHALLEERCMKQVLDRRRRAGDDSPDHPGRHQDAIQREAGEIYQRLCAQLGLLSLVSPGLQDDQYAMSRQRVREGLDRMAAVPSTTGTHQPTPPTPFRRLLTDTAQQPVYQSASAPASLIHTMVTGIPSPMASRYIQDFEEIGILGKGGFGKVFHVRHKLDGCAYAVKKVPIRPSVLARIASPGGQAVLDDILAEVRSLSRLQHPNVVRYFNSWIEWSDVLASASHDSSTHTSESRDAQAGAQQVPSFSTAALHRVRTKSDVEQDVGFIFENSQPGSVVNLPESQTLDQVSQSASLFSLGEIPNEGLLSTNQPILALHVQMSIHPMTLSEFLAPPTMATTVKPLAHCFHMEPSLRILLALFDGVEYLHANGVVHRDLKPANIFLRHEVSPMAVRECVDLSRCLECCKDGTANPATLSVCIGDFGLVTQIAHSETDLMSRSPGNAVGTEIYRPTTSRSNVSPRLDIFALGIIACELLLKFDTQMERRKTLQSLREGNFPETFARSVGEQYSINIKECVAAMLADDSEESGTIAEYRRRLSSVLQDHERQEINKVGLQRTSA